LYGAWVKSFKETHPDLGVANTPDDVHLKVDGSEHVPPPGVAVGGGPPLLLNEASSM
jgi:hypothetical protein